MCWEGLIGVSPIFVASAECKIGLTHDLTVDKRRDDYDGCAADLYDNVIRFDSRALAAQSLLLRYLCT